MLKNKCRNMQGQISLEFLIVYVMVLTVFVIIFGLIASQRALTINEQQASYLQLIAQNIASRIDQALAAGNGYSVTIPLAGVANNNPYNLYITSTGTILVNATSNGEALSTQAFANARSIIINGTLLTASTNAIKIYKIPLYSGVITLSNYYGTIYIDKEAPNNNNLSVYSNLKDIGSNGAAALISKYNAPAFINTTFYRNITSSGWTESAWVYINGPAATLSSGYQNIILDDKGAVSSGESLTLGEDQGGSLNFNNFNLFFGLDSSGITQIATTNTIYLYKKWYLLTGTYNLSYGLKTYVDGKLAAYYTNGGVYGPGSSGTTGPLGSPPFNSITPWYFGRDSDWNTYFNGSLSNVQLYNSSLSANQIYQLYNEGIDGAPINTNSLIAWWPLNGNLNNYATTGGSEMPHNLTYINVNELTTHANLYNGANASNTIIGYISNNGNLSSYGKSVSNITTNNGNSYVFINTPVGYGSSNISEFLLNQNRNLNNNVVIWAPITPIEGNIIYDLSGHYNNGIFNNYSFSSNLSNATNIEVGTFNGINTYINGNLSAIYSKSVTLSAWINESGVIGNEWQNILQINGTPLTSEVMDIGIDAKTGNAIMRWTNNANTILNQINATPIKRYKEYFITGIWNGVNNTLSLYVNGAYDGQVNGNGTADTILNKIDIGGGYSGMHQFNGSISNVQAYNGTLNKYQIDTLYNRGPYGNPLSGLGLLGWWPLDGNANDYSGNIAMVNNQVVFANRMFYGHNTYIPALNISNNPVYDMNTPITNIGYNYSVNIWFMIRSENGNTPLTNNPCCTLMNPIMSIYDGSSNGGIGINQNFNYGSMFAGGKTHALSWIYDMPLGSGSTICSTPSDIVYPGIWYDAIVSVYKYSNITIYLNGINYTRCISGDAIPTSTLTSALKTDIGIMPAASTYYLGNESIADMEILNKTLNQSEAISIYHNGLPQIHYINAPT